MIIKLDNSQNNMDLTYTREEITDWTYFCTSQGFQVFPERVTIRIQSDSETESTDNSMTFCTTAIWDCDCGEVHEQQIDSGVA